MAKYYLGNTENKQYKPIIIPDVGTKITDIVKFTTSFADEQELREYLLENNLIKYYDDQLGFLMEEGSKDNRTYKLLPMGTHIPTALQKQNLKKENVYRFGDKGKK